MGPRALSYDANGNQTGWSDSAAGQSRTLVWDAQDRVTSTTTAGSAVTFRYNADGQRTHKHSAAGTTQYLNGFVTVRNGVAATRHVFVGEQRIASSVMAGGMTSAAQLHFYYHGDHLQSAQFVTDGAGAVTEHYEYLPFGEPWIDESASAERTPYRYIGTERDEETSLQYMGARYYDPRQSQWLSTDPILASYMGGAPGGGVYVPVNLSLYSYSWNRPTVLRDPGGQCPQCVPVGIGVAVVLIVGAGTPADQPSAYDGQSRVPPVHILARDGLGAMGVGAVLGAGARAAGAAVERWIEREIAGPVGEAVESAFAGYAREVRAAENVGSGGASGPSSAVSGGGSSATTLETQLLSRAAEVHQVLHPVAQRMRTSSILQTDSGRVVAGGRVDLTRAQITSLGPGEIPASGLPGVDAEITAMSDAQ